MLVTCECSVRSDLSTIMFLFFLVSNAGRDVIMVTRKGGGGEGGSSSLPLKRNQNSI